MGRRSSVGFVLATPKTGDGRLSMGGRRSMGGMGPPANPPSGGATTTTPTSEFLDVPENNDDEERRQRQLSRLQQLQNSRQLRSPSADPTAAVVGDRRKSVSTLEPRLTGLQLSQHYAKCIQLSAENKINIKNAFNLQLIDYMTDMLRRKDASMNNFQVASCTLDASTKIYAYRVDCIHTDTMRIAGGLGRTAQEKGAERDQEAAEGDEQEGTKVKRRRTKKAATIESNPSNLTLSSLDLEFMVDPLYKKIASQFDEGRAGGGLFLNSLMLRDDACQMLLDSEAVLDTVPDDTVATTSISVTVPSLPDLNKKEICPSFSSFHFTSWKVGDEDSFCNTSLGDDDKPLDHAFDINAVPEPLDDDNMYGDDNADYGGGVEEGNDMDDDDTAQATLGVGGNNTCLTVGWTGQHATAAPHHAMETIHLKDHLATMPLEYSYFDSRVMSAWAGPGHWKLKPAARDKAYQLGAGSEGSKRRKKDTFELEYRIEPEARAAIDKQFNVTKRMTKLSQNTIKLWSEEVTTLPADLHFDPNDFAKLYGRVEVVVRRQLVEDTQNTTHEVDETGQDNNDDDDMMDHGADDGGAAECDNSGVGYDMTLFSQTLLAPSHQPGEFAGDNLVVAPNKVAKVNIGYARTAKRMDMKKLKGTLWSMLSTNADKENDSNSANMDPPPVEDKEEQRMAAGKSVSFSQVYRKLPQHLNARMAENLSLSLAFIAILHLCNEKNLRLMPLGDMEDFAIKQD